MDETQVYQTIEGFGAATTDSAMYLLNEVANPKQLTTAMSNLFTRQGGGIGLSFLRNPMGASDLARSVYSFDDNGGQPDPTLANFSIAHDQADIIPLILQAKALNPQLEIMANPWSPPGWMKDSGSMIGGSLLSSMYAPFANYFVKYVQAYAQAGINITSARSCARSPFKFPPTNSRSLKVEMGRSERKNLTDLFPDDSRVPAFPATSCKRTETSRE
ncbi:MAG: hypothetical protein ABSD45_23010 [Terriglobia bacterium]|jgi:glucosylceramidase